jgi:imidazoleglycerol-phosphate dehydratase
MDKRKASYSRKTRETTIDAEICLDGDGKADVDTGVGFLDHMLELLARHGLFDITIRASGDLYIDDHHSTEDVGIVLGYALREALGDKKGITRFAHARVPMQEALAETAIDICGRPYLSFNGKFPAPKVGQFDVELVEEFLQALVAQAGITAHIDIIRGNNTHHMAEAVFKSLARALRSAVAIDPAADNAIPSTKGVL